MSESSEDSTREVIVISGYPGAGKSLAGKALSESIDGIFIETGDIVREEAAKYFDRPVEELSSHELGEYSTMRREKDGGDYVIQDVCERLEKRDDFPEKPVILSGLRDTESIPLLSDWSDEYWVIWIEASFETRLERLQSRGRQDENSYTEEELKKRDKRERKWGLESMREERDFTVNNDENMQPEMAKENLINQFTEINFYSV